MTIDDDIHVLREAKRIKMVKPPTLVWNYYKKVEIKGKKHGVCIFCETSYQSHAGRMRKHLSTCSKCPENVKKIFLKSLDCPEFKVENNVPPSGDIDCYYVPDPNYISMESASNTNLDEAESAEDEFDIFGRYIASELRKIKSEEHRNEIKRKILQIIIDITAQNENLGDADLE